MIRSSVIGERGLEGEEKMKWLMFAAAILVSCITTYSCASKCVTVPPPGGLSYDETGEQDKQADRDDGYKTGG